MSKCLIFTLNTLRSSFLPENQFCTYFTSRYFICIQLYNICRQIQLKMLNKRMKTQGSGILSLKDLDSYFNVQKFRKVSSPTFSRSQCQSPKSESSSKQLQKSQNETDTQILQEQIQRLNDLITLEKNRNDLISSQNSALVNQLHVQETLIEQLRTQKQKLIDEIHYIRKGYQQVQQQRNKLLMQAGRYRNQVNAMTATLDINQQQISNLQHTNKILIDQLNFDKQMLADYKQENTTIKAQFKNITNAFVNLKQFINQQKQRFIKEEKQVLDKRINQLRQNFFEFRDQIRDITRQLKQIDLRKQDVFSFVRRLKLTFQSTRTQLNIAKSLTGNFDQNEGGSSLFIVRQAQYRKSIENQQQKIKSLTTEIAALKKKNAQLSDLIESQQRRILSPNFHTNSNYLNKVLKQNHREIMEIKEIIQIKDEQIQRLKQALQLEKGSSNLKNEQIERLQVVAKLAKTNLYSELNIQIEQLKSQKLRLDRRIEQLSQNQHSLKAQIAQKDRIILNYVQKSKIK